MGDIQKRWFDNDLHLMKCDRINALTKAKMSNVAGDWTAFENLNREYKKKINIKVVNTLKQKYKMLVNANK